MLNSMSLYLSQKPLKSYKIQKPLLLKKTKFETFAAFVQDSFDVKKFLNYLTKTFPKNPPKNSFSNNLY